MIHSLAPLRVAKVRQQALHGNYLTHQILDHGPNVTLGSRAKVLDANDNDTEMLIDFLVYRIYVFINKKAFQCAQPTIIMCLNSTLPKIMHF